MLIGFKSGTFTLLTKGHVECLRYCKSKCDYLIVGINDDNYLINKKGFCIVPAIERKQVIQSIKFVNKVIVYSGKNEQRLLEKLQRLLTPKNKLIVFHSKEMLDKEFIPGSDIAEIVYCPQVKSSSTTDIINRIKNNV